MLWGSTPSLIITRKITITLVGWRSVNLLPSVHYLKITQGPYHQPHEKKKKGEKVESPEEVNHSLKMEMITDDIFYLQLKTEDRHELVVPVYITSEEFEMLNTKNAKF